MNTTSAGGRVICTFVLASVLWLGGGTARSQLLPEEQRLIAGEIQSASISLQARQPNLPGRELSRLAEITGRSNYLARAIATAVSQNNFTNAARLLKEFPGSVNDVAPYGQSLLYNAVQMGSTGAVSFLLEQKADPNRAGRGEEPLLSMAIEYTRWSVALQLVEAGAVATGTNRWGQTPLSRILDYIYSPLPANDVRNQLLDKMLARGADAFAPVGPNDTNSILERVLSRRNERFGDLLLTNQPSPVRRTPGGNTALHLAALYGRTNALEFLLAAGFSVEQTNANGLTPLQLIAPWVPPANPGRLYFSGQQSYPSRIYSGGGMSGPSAPPQEVAGLLLRHGAKLDVFCAAALGRTNELKALLLAEPARAKARDSLGRTALHYATEASQLPAARLLLQSGADASATTGKAFQGSHWILYLGFPDGGGWFPSGTSPLHVAALHGESELVELLLRAGAAVTPVDGEGDTPLHLAAHGAPTNCLALLVAARSPLNATNQAGKSPLRLAVESGRADNTELLLKAGALPKVGVTNETLMHIAAERGGSAVLQVLYRYGLAIEARDGKGRTPFQRAVAARQWDPLSWLWKKGADINTTDAAGNTALHLLTPEQYDMVGRNLEQSPVDRLKQQWLSQPGKRQQLLQKLISWKVVSAPSPMLWTNSSLTAWLLEQGARPNATNRLGQTPLATLCGQQWMAYGDGSVTNRVADLLKAGARPDLPDIQGVTPLHVAASNASPAVLRQLLQQVPRPGALRDGEGHSLLYYVRQRPGNGPASLALLLAAGVDPNDADKKGSTVLHWAVENYHTSGWQPGELALLLLTNKANPNVQDRQGMTPLHLALATWQDRFPRQYYNGQEVVSMLLTNGANPNLRDREGETPLHLLARTSIPVSSDDRLSQLWLAQGDFTLRDKAGQTPLHLWAANTNHYGSACTPLAKTVLTNKTLLSLTNAAGDTLLHTAIQAQNYPALRLLMDAGVDPALRNAQGESAFRLAAALMPGNRTEQMVKPAGAQLGFFHALQMRDRKSVDLWLKADPSLCSVTNREGQTPLMVASATTGDRSLERKLLSLGAPLDLLSAMRLGRWEDFHQLLPAARGAIGPACLFEAVRLGRQDAVRDLVNAGGDFQAADGEGHSLLYRAATAGQTNLVAWLLARTARETIFDALSRGERQPVEELLNATPALANATNAQGRTPLLVATAAGNAELVSLLLARGAKLDACTADEWTALHLAAARNLAEIAEVLLRAGANPNQLARGLGPLHLAGAFDAAKVAAVLLDHGAAVNLLPQPGRGAFGNTPLHWAAHLGCFETVKLLLARGADVEALNWSRETPADLVMRTARSGGYGFGVPPEAPRLTRGLRTETDRTMMLHLLDEAKAKQQAKPGPAH